VEWLAPIVLIPATIVVLVLCARSAVRALRAEKEQRKDLGSNREEED
jgi:cytochrome c-type biogenesis protein CcmH/NrfF